MDRSQYSLFGAISASFFLHAFLIGGVVFVMPEVKHNPIKEPLEIVLVNQKTKTAPSKVDVLAQVNSDGGGNTDAKQRSKSPLPATSEEIALEQTVEQQKALEAQAEKMMTRLKADWSMPNADAKPRDKSDKGVDQQQLKQQARELAAQAAQISKDYNAYQEKPRKAYVGARAKQTSVALWADGWAQKVERVGTFSYPIDANGKKLRGSLRVTVEINHDGSILNAQVDRSSGNKALDEAALRILRLAAPFSRLPLDMVDDTGKPATVLVITRTWVFGRDSTLGLD